MMRWITTCLCVSVWALRCRGEAALAVDYFEHKDAPHLCYFTCGYPKNTILKDFMNKGIRVSMQLIDKHEALDLQRSLLQWNLPVGVLLDAGCGGSGALLEMASRAVLFDAMHMWLILESAVRYENTSEISSLDVLRGMNLSIDADVVIAVDTGEELELMDIFNFGKIQGNNLETKYIGTWSPLRGLNVSLSRFKYYDRWDFHNLTLRAISVILDRPKVFKPEMLSDLGYTVGVSVMTKIVTQLLWVLKDIHNFRFNYTIAGRWIGSPERNSTLAVTNSLYWGEQDISCTCARIFTQWLDWVDVFFPPATRLETNFYYLILDKGVGDYENRFLTPLSAGVWWCTIVASIICAIILAISAVLEDREEPGLYASFSVFAVICQQAYEDGINLFDEISSSQGRRLILLVVGMMSMLLYNYYTSSVVSWLLNAAAPTLADMDALINSDLELVFEDIGYTRGWLDNPGFFYYSGYKNPKEDVLRMKKVTNAKRTTELLQPTPSVSLIRSGQYAYHTEPYNAYQVISKTFEDKELCELGSLQMMAPAYVYIMAQKRSPYKQFFVWRSVQYFSVYVFYGICLFINMTSWNNLFVNSLMRLLERGHTSAARARVSGYKPTCSGRTPRALALGQAAPAFAILTMMAIVSVGILVCEIYYHRAQIKRVQGFNNRAYNVQRRTDSRGT